MIVAQILLNCNINFKIFAPCYGAKPERTPGGLICAFYFHPAQVRQSETTPA